MIALLSVGIMAYSIGASYAQIECPPGYVLETNKCVEAIIDPVGALQIQTDQDIYADGNTIMMSGTINNYDPEAPNAVTIVVRNPVGNPVGLAQIMPNSDGTFSTSFLATGSIWKSAGAYTITANYGPDNSDITFEFGGSAATVIPPQEDPPEEKDERPPPPPPPPPDDKDEPPPPPKCGPGTEPDENGICQLIKPVEPVREEPTSNARDNGCLIATAAYGTELASQVQLLREVRDGTLYSTTAGTSFMTGFNQLYYSFSPTIADWERQSPAFKEAVRSLITPMISSLSIMTLADEGSEAEVLGYGISVIALNLGMYIAAPIGAVFGIRKYLKSRA